MLLKRFYLKSQILTRGYNDLGACESSGHPNLSLCHGKINLYLTSFDVGGQRASGMHK